MTVGSGRWSTYKSKKKLSIAVEVALAVPYLHSFSLPTTTVFHGNRSPRNVFVDSECNVSPAALVIITQWHCYWVSPFPIDISTAPQAAAAAAEGLLGAGGWVALGAIGFAGCACCKPPRGLADSQPDISGTAFGQNA
ncbi:unnamed protein product [Phytophthora fragariaefolia]|uniref:Unnamed protein product n=1 Tax=Phytophthora fragariaefolia TaxID=1490495 RepID=A0A9W6TRI3_9STRA|nr:unnamed protein product [Phytophthora fragariaefolia]